MRLRNVKNAKEIITSCDFVIKNPKDYCGKFHTLFQKKQALHLEIGMGKGQFLYQMAILHPEINFIGIEKYESVLVRAVEKMINEPLPNLKFICMDAKEIDTVFHHEISCLYLNFSDPWPKNRHAKRRLTSPIFLQLYESIFVKEKHIILKTDNLILFASSLKELNNFGYKFQEVSLDLANTSILNVETEYEMKFKKEGIKINYLEATKK